MSAVGKELLAPITLRGGLELSNRVVVAPMTRSRASEPEGVPSPQAPLYYAQRASAGLIVTEATNISIAGKGFAQTPGIHTDEQEAAWAQVASAVHEADGRIFMQHWHVGRLANRFTCEGVPVAPSPQTAPASVWAVRPDGTQGVMPCDEARELTVDEIAGIVNDHRQAAIRSVRAGFDGVELHGANGYLIDQFLRSATNWRTDRYGGSPRARGEFLREVVEAVAEEIGPERVGVRFSPKIGYSDGFDPEIDEAILSSAADLEAAGIAYIHIAEGDTLAEDVGKPSTDFWRELRDAFSGTLIVAHQYDVDRAEEALAQGRVDMVAFGRPFLANPDLVERIRDGIEWEPTPDRMYWYGAEAAGYVDWPTYREAQAARTAP